MDRVPATTAQGPHRPPAAEPEGRRPLTHLAPATRADPALVQLMRDGPAAAARRQALQRMFGDAARLPTRPPVVQRIVKSDNLKDFIQEQWDLQIAFIKGTLPSARPSKESPEPATSSTRAAPKLEKREEKGKEREPRTALRPDRAEAVDPTPRPEPQEKARKERRAPRKLARPDLSEPVDPTLKPEPEDEDKVKVERTAPSKSVRPDLSEPVDPTLKPEPGNEKKEKEVSTTSALDDPSEPIGLTPKPKVRREKKKNKETEHTKKSRRRIRSESTEKLRSVSSRDMDNPAPRYTTAGFEHEFAQMMDGPLKGVSHLELAQSDIRLPVKDLPFILETDAQNSLELVSPPFLLETLPDAPIPLPEDVKKVDDILGVTLRKATGSNGGPLGIFMQRFGGAAGFNFTWIANKDKVTIERKNFSQNTGDEIKSGLFGRAPKISTETLKDIAIGPSTKGQDSLVDATNAQDLRSQFGPKANINTTGAVITQVNFATTAEVFEAMRRLSRGGTPGDEVSRDLQTVTQKFRETLIATAFPGEVGLRGKLVEAITEFRDDFSLRVPERTVTQRSPRRTFKDRLTALLNKLQSSALDRGDLPSLVKEFEDIISSARNDLPSDDAMYWPSLGPAPEKKKEKEDPPELSAIEEIKKGILRVPEVGAQSPSLRTFLNALARTLAGLIAVPAQDVLRSAQEKRMAGKLAAMTQDTIGYEANLISHVKDLDQSWLKDNIINFGMGFLQPGDWKQVLALLDPGGGFAAAIDQMLATTKFEHVNPKLRPYLAQLSSTVRQALEVLSQHIKGKGLHTDRPDPGPIGPGKAPDFLEGAPGVFGARQDTFIHPGKTQLPGLWTDQLHVVESRWRSAKHIQDLADAWRRDHPLPEPRVKTT